MTPDMIALGLVALIVVHLITLMLLARLTRRVNALEEGRYIKADAHE